jgi:hypothetical protein
MLQKYLIGGLLVAGLVVSTFLLGRSAGIDSERAKRTENAEATVKQKTETENKIVEERVVYRDRIQKVREVVVDCTLPADLIGLLRESGVFKAGEVRDTPNN